MITIGIDPGTDRVGFGIISGEHNTYTLIDAGIFSHTETQHGKKLLKIQESIRALLNNYHPDCVAIEKLFFSKNQKTAMQVAEARGVLICICEELAVPYVEYTPNEVKLNITGNGNADKKTVLKMVRLFLKHPKLDIIDDASDALALAILAQNTTYRTIRTSTY